MITFRDDDDEKAIVYVHRPEGFTMATLDELALAIASLDEETFDDLKLKVVMRRLRLDVGTTT